MILVIAAAHARPDRREDMVALLAGLARRSRGEQGCTSYVFTSDIEDPNAFTSIEQWESREDLDRHMGTPELAEALSKLPDMITAEPTITVHEVSRTAPYGS
ncbi:antibiotic biosynthesis monooxygenase [Modestobacter sp. I12A-02628]|uniref:Antibiotic biosynthesis monooxygenase n=1 Tax=Goekera deserti TaxID=2497753 RepID=A0A7K3WLW0_9ACTN|nr:putative quinol monooxygenase [Goekera deserti]MPQ98183.1 antibiotic biosynthesis monooxygenase [Goekera deserti]NDI48832.1 antibiotic biosynthesis monooxygenase [Goekera deserti]NEL56513.1 antibiotic biosynthesis monooxygenase [Goekera deserti]